MLITAQVQAFSLVMGSGAVNTIVYIEAVNGAEALIFLASKACSALLFAAPKLIANARHTFYQGDSVCGGSDFNDCVQPILTKDTKIWMTFTTRRVMSQIAVAKAVIEVRHLQ